LYTAAKIKIYLVGANTGVLQRVLQYCYNTNLEKVFQSVLYTFSTKYCYCYCNTFCQYC